MSAKPGGDKALMNSRTGEVISYLLDGTKFYSRLEALAHLRKCEFIWSAARKYLTQLESDAANR